jgi:hypothetical protein
MSETDYNRLEARITALFLLQAQTFSLAVTNATGAGREGPLIERYHAMALKYAKLWRPEIRDDATEALDTFFAPLIAANRARSDDLGGAQ